MYGNVNLLDNYGSADVNLIDYGAIANLIDYGSADISLLE